MANQIRLLIWGDYACFTRPEMKVERVSYDVITPSALSASEANRDLGWMLHDIDFDHGNTPHFFRAQMKEGVIDVPPFYAEEVKA